MLKIKDIIRMGCFLLVLYVLQYPILLFARTFPNAFSYIFVVYPGTDSDLAGYCPQWIAKKPTNRSRPVIGGIISKSQNGKIGRGLVVVVSNTVRNLVSSNEECRLLQSRLLKIAKFISVRAIAIIRK